MYRLACILLICLSSPISGLNRSFPDYFQFGVATASYQVEGAWDEDNKSENIWDHLTHIDPDFVDDRQNGDVACDAYHHYEEDVRLIRALGVDFYRFSLSWSRIIPLAVAGSPVNLEGIAYYRKVIDGLIENGIEPAVTIYHWDLPQILQDLGGWPNPQLVEHFAYYARTVFEAFGDSVKIWMTFNEPMQTCQQGYGSGAMAPAIQAAGIADYACTHTLLKAHARAYHIYDDEFRDAQKGRVGIVIDCNWMEPESDSEEDLAASERALQFNYGWFGNPVFNGDYPQIMKERVALRSRGQGLPYSRLPEFTEEEIAYINGTHDFLALNSYTTDIVAATPEAPFNEVSYWNDENVNMYQDPDWPSSASSWLKVVPWGIRKLLNWIKNTYGDPEIFITESGFSDRGDLDDQGRIDYYREYLSNILDAVLDDGVNVTHYTAWSLMDNMEWARGYTEKYGLYQVDFTDPDRKRTPKASALYFQQVTSRHCLWAECED